MYEREDLSLVSVCDSKRYVLVTLLDQRNEKFPFKGLLLFKSNF